jgi:UDP-perosamine 4-acetyltransferase
MKKVKKIIVIGSGGHAKVVIDILHEMGNYEIIGVTSNSLLKGTIFSGYKVLGDDNSLIEFSSKEISIAMGIGGFRDNVLREKIFRLIKSLGFSFVNVIHPSAKISKTVKLGESVVIFPGVVVNTDVEIGDNTIIATSSSIDHETFVGENVLISAGVTIGAYSRINDNALIALGAKIISGVDIGKNVLVAAGAVVIKDVLPDEIVFGIPAAPKKRKL